MTTKLGRTATLGIMRDLTQLTDGKNSGILVIVRNSKSWNRDAFFVWLLPELAKADPPIPHLGRLAELAGMHPSTISNWKTGKSSPTTVKLSAIADVLGKPRAELWQRAGLMGDDIVSVSADGEVSASQVKGSTEDWGVAMILASNLSEAAKRTLLELHEEDARRARAEAERQLRDKINLLSASEQK